MSFAPIFKTWANWTKALLAFVFSSGVFGLGAYEKAVTGFQPPPINPEFWDICVAAWTRSDYIALIGAALAGLSALASLFQLIAPKPAGEKLVKKLFGELRELIKRSFAAADTRQVQRHVEVINEHEKTQAIIKADRFELVIAEIKTGSAPLEMFQTLDRTINQYRKLYHGEGKATK